MSAVASVDHARGAAERASGSSFYAAMRILPKPQRAAMYEVYSFCRLVDDIADEGGPRARRLADLDGWRDDLAALYAGRPPAHLAGLATAVAAFGLRQRDFLDVIDGMAMDAAADIRAPDAATLDLYCDRVASAVGRLSVRIFGLGEDDGDTLAHHLGRALQLTNIMRDLDEDAGIGRLYLPREALEAAGVGTSEPVRALADSERLARACAPLIDQATAHFARARAVMERCPRRATRAPRLMAAAYGMILRRLIARGFAPPRARIRTPKALLLLAVLRHGFL